jgi:hypothetical protein
MDAICAPEGSQFKLQVQQDFLKDYISTNPAWKNLLLYHQIGSGKTCTAITLAEEFMRQNQKNRVTIILPARLKTNFIDEFVSPCGMGAYISATDFEAYYDPLCPASRKKTIRAKFMKKISKRYEIISFNKLKTLSMSTTNMNTWIKTFTKNKMLIIDEVHNLISATYDEVGYQRALSTGIIPRGAKGAQTILFKFMTMKAHASCKMLYLTATPVFYNVAQFRELVILMNPGLVLPKKTTAKEVIDHLRGKVSFFPGTSVNAYPEVIYETHGVEISKLQDVIIGELQRVGDDNKNEDSDGFYSKERQACLAVLAMKTPVHTNLSKVASNLKVHAPKMLTLLEQLQAKGKHVVYSSFVESGCKLIAFILKKNGFISIDEVLKNPEMWKKYKYKVFAMWDGKTNDAQKQIIKQVINGINNLDGELVRILIGSPSIKEGVSFKHIQHIHLMDPVWNNSGKNQIEGRAIRFCSHVDIPAAHPFLKRQVVVHLYKLMGSESAQVQITSDMLIYDKIIPNKKKDVDGLESALKKVSIDYHLFRNIYRVDVWDGIHKKTNSDPNSRSVISIEEDVNLFKKSGRNGSDKKKNTCPKNRRPIGDVCNPNVGAFMRENGNGDMCCFKKPASLKAVVPASSCPVARRPNAAGKCAEGFEARLNKHGVMCCYRGGLHSKR